MKPQMAWQSLIEFQLCIDQLRSTTMKMKDLDLGHCHLESPPNQGESLLTSSHLQSVERATRGFLADY